MLDFRHATRTIVRIALVSVAFLSLALAVATMSDSNRKADAATGAVLTVDASEQVYPFRDGIRGVATSSANWLWSGLWDRGSSNSCCAPGKAEAILDATSYIKPGVIRFGGARWVNRTGWSRDGSAPDDGYWRYTDPQTSEVYEYTHAYRPGMVDAFADFTSELGAQAIIQINVCDNNPRMWQDLLTYTNIENSYDFKYWELGNEQSLDDESCGLDAYTYADRFVIYQDALKDVDPSIELIGPIAHQPYFPDWEDELFSEMGSDLDVLGFHWYQLVNWSYDPSSFAYQGGSLESLMAYDGSVGSACHDGFGCAGPGTGIPDYQWNRWVYRRGIAEQKMEYIKSNYKQAKPDLETAITEFGVLATDHEHPINSNHAAAVWMADVLPRWSYNGLDMIAFFSLEDGATWGGNSRGLMGINSYDVIDIRPIYYTSFMYAQYFGDMMLKTGTSDEEQKVVVWASSDRDDSGKLKLMLVNLSQDTSVAQVRINGFNANSGVAYEMRSDDPTSMANPGSSVYHSTTINGVRIPDYDVNNPSGFRNAIDSIQPQSVSMSSDNFDYTLEPFSVVAVTLDGTFGSSSTPTPTPTTPPSGQTQAGLKVSPSSNRSASVDLAGQTVEDDIYVWVSPDSGVESASFYLDDPTRSGQPRKVENLAPFDLEGTSWTGSAVGFDTTALSDGSHNISVALRLSDGTTAIKSATFTVNNSDGPTPTPTPTQETDNVEALFSFKSDRSSGMELDGSIVSGDIYVWANPDEEIDSVSFYVDDPSASGAPIRTENFEPFDLAGTAFNGSGNAVDTSSLTDGPHRLTMRVTMAGSSQIIVTSAFTVSNTPAPEVDIRAGYGADRGSSFTLNGSTISGDVHIWVPAQSGLSSVSFFIDDPTLSLSPYRTENLAPFDMGGTYWTGDSQPVSTVSLSNGAHVLTVRLTMSDGQVITSSSAFTVRN